MTQLLPGIQSKRSFDYWRIVPYDRTLLYNFNNLIEIEEEAIALICDHFEKGSVIAARQLPLSENTNIAGTTTAAPITIDTSPVIANDNSININDKQKPLVIEVLFASDELRIEALRRDIKYNGTTFRPVTTTTDPAKFTVISLSQMALIPESERIPSFRHWVNTILLDAKATKISEGDILHIWLETDKYGIYRGSGTVILNGYDEKMAQLKNNNTRAYMNAPNYPNPRCHIQLGYMCCDQCRMLDDHNTEDCIYQEKIQLSEEQPKDNNQSTSETSTETSTSNTVEPPSTSVPKVISSDVIDLDQAQVGKNKRKEKKGEENEEENSKEKSPRRTTKRVRLFSKKS